MLLMCGLLLIKEKEEKLLQSDLRKMKRNSFEI
jgi:hypothetical protein